MTAKDVRVAFKRDDGVRYLLEKFGFENEEELFESIRRVLPSESEMLIKRMEKRKKRSERIAKNSSLQKPQEVSNEEESVREEATQQVVSRHDLLKEQERELSSEVVRLEGEHKKLVAERRTLVSDLLRAKKALQELTRILSEQERNVTAIVSKYNDCAAEMLRINEAKSSLNDLLDDTRRQIASLQKITILVYQDGRIETEGFPIDISDDEMMKELTNLIGIQGTGELTINELKAIARLLIKLRDEKRQAELVFDNPKAQSFWEKIFTQP